MFGRKLCHHRHSKSAKRPAARESCMEIYMRDSQIGGLNILARRNVLTETDWFDLLLERRTLLEPYLREMTLKTLGDLKVVNDRSGNERRPLRMGGMVKKILSKNLQSGYRPYWIADKLETVEGNFPLETRGIFPDDDIYYHGHFKWDFIGITGRVDAVGEILRFWGLTRNNQWIKAEATIHFSNHPSVPVFDRDLGKMAEVLKLTVSESTPSEICQFCRVTPRWLWQRLSDAVEAWVKHREHLLSNAEQLFEVIKQENTLASIVAPQ